MRGSGQRRRAARRRAGGLVLVEGGAVLLLCLAYAVSLLAGKPHNRGLALVGAGLGALLGLVLVLLGRALAGSTGRRAWSPALVAQLLAVPVGVGLVQGRHLVLAVLVLCPALLAALLLVLGAPRPDESPQGDAARPAG